MYAIYHGPKGLLDIAQRVHRYTIALSQGIRKLGYKVKNEAYFDTLSVHVGDASAVHSLAEAVGINLRQIDSATVGVTLDESVNQTDLVTIMNTFCKAAKKPLVETVALDSADTMIPSELRRTSEYLTQPVFNEHHSETELMRYIHHLQSKDLSLVHAMIPLGSCTMKLNSASSMIPLTMPQFNGVHPFAPVDQVQGYQKIIKVCAREAEMRHTLMHIYRSLSPIWLVLLAFTVAHCNPTRELQESMRVYPSFRRIMNRKVKVTGTSA